MDLKLEQFEGPLDLLLHLIRSNKIDIYDIPIFELTSQYTDYLKKMEELNMDIAGEFIVMASELLYIKSKMLLPSDKEKFPEEEEDPRNELVKKLIDYKKYSEISSFFKTREQIGINAFTKPGEKIKGLIKYKKFNMEPESLTSSLKILAERVAQRINSDESVFFPIVKREIVSVDEMEKLLLSSLSFDFKRELIEVFCEICTTKAQVAAAFMALLDLMKEEQIYVSSEYFSQEEKFMLIRYNGGAA